MKTIFLWNARDNKTSARKVLGKADSWVYIGRDYSALLHWESALAGTPRIFTGARFHEISQRLRGPFFDWLRNPGQAAEDVAWWASPLAETNTLRENLFQKICCLVLAKELIERHPGPRLLIVVENPILLRQIAEWCDARAYQIRRPRYRERWPGWLSFALWFFAKWIYGTNLLLYNWILSWWTRPHITNQIDSRRLVLVKTFVDEPYFRALGNDRYWGPLLERMRGGGWDVRSIPWIYSTKRSRLSAYRWMRARSDYFLIPEDYYKASDILWAARCVARQYRLSPASSVVAGHDCRLLIREARWRGAADSTNIQMALYARLALRLKEAGIRPRLLLNICENMIPEKMLLWGFQRDQPGTKTVGFQHILIPPRMLLQQYSSARSTARPPLPDRIVCNSELTRSLLQSEGYDPGRLRVGASLRNLELIGQQPRPPADRREVLVPLALDLSAAAEVIDKILTALPAKEGIPIVFKPHPMMKGSELARAIGPRALPLHAKISESPLNELLETAGCVASASTTALVEIALSGIAPIVVGRECDVNVSPFDGIEGAPTPIFTAREIHSAVFRALSRQGHFNEEPWLTTVRQSILSPLTDESTRAYCEFEKA